ncbi:MAG: hypothetical protein QME71_06895 [Dehalococcoidia bacterium]|nr:hypothetical protein [Dehalococcoidia bacterium]
MQLLAQGEEPLLLPHELLVLFSHVLGEHVLLLHNLDDTPDTDRQVADLLLVPALLFFQRGQRPSRVAIGGIHARLEDAGVVAEVGQNLLD